MKRNFLLVPVVVFPYLILFAIVCIFSGYFMDSLFQNNALLLLFALLIFYIVALACTVVSFITGIAKKKSGLALFRASMIIKLLHIPSYVLIFIIGLLCLITIFTFAITIVLMILDCMTIFLTGLIGLCGIIRSFKENKLSKNEAIIHGVLQFVFCADVISSIMVYKKTKIYAI